MDNPIKMDDDWGYPHDETETSIWHFMGMIYANKTRFTLRCHPSAAGSKIPQTKWRFTAGKLNGGL